MNKNMIIDNIITNLNFLAQLPEGEENKLNLFNTKQLLKLEKKSNKIKKDCLKYNKIALEYIYNTLRS